MAAISASVQTTNNRRQCNQSECVVDKYSLRYIHFYEDRITFIYYDRYSYCIVTNKRNRIQRLSRNFLHVYQ